MKVANAEVGLASWKKRFREYVRKKGGMGLCDSLGGPLDFSERGRAMWNQDLVIFRDGPYVYIRVFKGGCACDADAKLAAYFIREFAAENGIFHLPVEFDASDGEGLKDFTMELTAHFDINALTRPDDYYDVDWVWVIGDTESRTFLGEKDDGFESHYVEVCDLRSAVHFSSFKDAVRAMICDDEVFSWVDEQGCANNIRPIMVEFRTMARAIRPART